MRRLTTHSNDMYILSRDRDTHYECVDLQTCKVVNIPKGDVRHVSQGPPLTIPGCPTLTERLAISPLWLSTYRKERIDYANQAREDSRKRGKKRKGRNSLADELSGDGQAGCEGNGNTRVPRRGVKRGRTQVGGKKGPDIKSILASNPTTANQVGGLLEANLNAAMALLSKRRGRKS